MRVIFKADNLQLFRQCEGVGLIEILVATLLLSVGLLGFLGLQALGLQAERSAFYRTSASLLSTDAIERIRANRAGYVASDYSSSAPSASESCFDSSGCSSKTLAQFDLHELQLRASGELPSGVLVVCRDNTPNDGMPARHECDGSSRGIAVKIWWDDNRDGIAETRVSASVAFP